MKILNDKLAVQFDDILYIPLGNQLRTLQLSYPLYIQLDWEIRVQLNAQLYNRLSFQLEIDLYENT